MTKANITKMGGEVAEELKDASWDQRFAWIMKVKEEGNALVQQKDYEKSIDTYLKALCGLDFGKQSPDQEERVNRELKAPILNNIALCLIKQEKYQRSITMLD